MFHRWCRIQTLDFVKKRKFSNLPVQHKIDGTRWDRIPYPLYARRVIYFTPIIIGGIIGTTIYLDPQFPENPNSEVVKDMFRRGFIVSTSLLITFPIIVVVMKTRVNWIWRQKVQYIASLMGSCAYFKYGELFPKSEFCSEVAPVLAVNASVLSAALLAPFSNNGWIVCSSYAALLTFIISCYFSNNYLQGILFDKEVSNWNSELKQRIASREKEMTVETMEGKEDKKYGNETLLHKIGLVWFGMALLCVPIWWQTTSVERFPIPHSMIEDLHSKIQKIPDPNPNMMTLSENYDILVSLILPDENADWNIEESSKYLTDWTSKMSDIAEFTVSSQIIYHPVSYDRPAKMGDAWNYSKSRLSNVINTIETHLDSNLNPNSKLIQLVILVPQFNRMPLFIEETNKRCLLPDWGSIAILDEFSSQVEGELQSLSGLELDVSDIIKSFVDDLEVLFDIKHLKMGRILKNLKTSSDSMVSLSSLLQRVHNMVINEDVANRISNAVQLGNKAYEYLERGEFDSALKLSRQSIQDSESAFFDPSLLELLYFPQDQKFAIYVPLFLPVALPILSGALQAFKYFKAHFLHSKKAKIE